MNTKESLEIAEKLAKDQPGQKTEFISTHRSFLVSLAAVERVQRTECILSDGSSVPVSRNAYKSVNEAFIRYYMEHGDMWKMRIPLITKYLEEYGYQNALLEKQVQEVQNIYLTMRGWRHDYHNHLQAMKAYVKMGEYDRLRNI